MKKNFRIEVDKSGATPHKIVLLIMQLRTFCCGHLQFPIKNE